MRRPPLMASLLAMARGREAGSPDTVLQDTIHRVDKIYVQVLLHRRASSVCSSNYSPCPATLNGGCCPENYECATDSCYATTAGTNSACGTMLGFYPCPISDGGEEIGSEPSALLGWNFHADRNNLGGCCPQGSLLSITLDHEWFTTVYAVLVGRAPMTNSNSRLYLWADVQRASRGKFHRVLPDGTVSLPGISQLRLLLERLCMWAQRVL